MFVGLPTIDLFFSSGICLVYAPKKLWVAIAPPKDLRLLSYWPFQMNFSGSIGSLHLRKNPIAWYTLLRVESAISEAFAAPSAKILSK